LSEGATSPDVPNTTDTEAVKRALRDLALGTHGRTTGGDGVGVGPASPAGIGADHGDGRDAADGANAGREVGADADHLFRRGAAALTDLGAAAAFRAASGPNRLRTAASDAERRDSDATARRYRRVADAFDAYRRAARGSDASRPPGRVGVPRRHRPSGTGATAPSPADDGTASDPDPSADHFRPAHGTPLSDDGQSGDR
jgi:hypothetical protein